ncbi:hypothetical protein VNO77_20458 [Canavalia gladiata]|uniref:Uncharacterized protein n=1 Tax=Canavalia gladiata TaxID=3824 RepID=A0AAN9LQ65_CANGL
MGWQNDMHKGTDIATAKESFFSSDPLVFFCAFESDFLVFVSRFCLVGCIFPRKDSFFSLWESGKQIDSYLALDAIVGVFFERNDVDLNSVIMK